MVEIDIAWRRLLEEVTEPILRLAFPRRRLHVIGPAITAGFDGPHQLTMDKLFVIRDEVRQFMLHIELEPTWRPTLPLRLLDEASVAHVLTRQPVVTVVLVLGRGGRPPRSPAEYRVPGIGTSCLLFRYHVVVLATYDAREMKRALPPEGWPFLVGMRGGGSPRSIRELAEEIVQQPLLTSSRRENALELLFLIAAALLGPHLARRVFDMESVIRSAGVQTLFRHLREEARMKGREEEARAALLHVLSRRGFPVEEEVRERVEGERDLAKLEAWLDTAVTAGSVADVFC